MQILGRDGEIKYFIEVKSTMEKHKAFVEITASEVAMAHRHRQRYILVRIVMEEVAASGNSPESYLAHITHELLDPLFMSLAAGSIPRQLHLRLDDCVPAIAH